MKTKKHLQILLIVITFMLGGLVLAGEELIEQASNQSIEAAVEQDIASKAAASAKTFRKIVIAKATLESPAKSSTNSAITPARYREMLANKQDVSMLNFLPFLIVALGWFLFKDESATAQRQTEESQPQTAKIRQTAITAAESKDKGARPEPQSTEEKGEQAMLDLAKSATRCQAETAKGSRCSRTGNLETIVITLKNRLYRFATCKQHNKDGFKPHPKVLKKR
ncbi:hypothetical protein Q9L42_006135 [Methylomarinum sp. Ch1-1]|uniref:Uncharacterized protein n=1 Tax=Methylomarinum roseum TaxID=3067653 RepID=A0AAU7NXC0_9GAMM|nr:hypothetical protein [Methylomarinum sp. Ch1-1]MDP4522204.1 hypothetical protein [Methylomarinum sp. Ch1-1]